MNDNTDIDRLISVCISIFDLEIDHLQKQIPLDRETTTKLIEYAKTLVIIRRDWRQGIKEDAIETKKMEDAELEAAVLAEAEKIKAKRGLV